MGFTDAIQSGFQRYFDFSSRSSRSEYWFWVLFVFIVNIVMVMVDSLLFGAGATVLGWIWTLAVLIPGLAVSVRRLHDLGKSGWWILIGLVPLIGVIVLLVWFVMPGQDDNNQWGSNPLGGLAMA